MIQHIKNSKYLFIYLFVWLFIGCKDKSNSKVNDDQESILLATKKNDNQIQYDWVYFNYFPIGDVILNDEKILRLKGVYKNMELKIMNDSIFFGSKMKEAIYTGNINSKKFFRRKYLYNYYNTFLNKKFNISLKDNLFYFRNKNIHKESILKKYFNEGFIIEDCLFAINESEGVIIVFKNKKSTGFDNKNSLSCLKDSILELPYNRKIGNTAKYNIAKCDIEGVSDWLCGEDELRYLPLFKNKKTTAILVPMDCGDFSYRYYLLSLYINKVVSNLYVEGEWYEKIENKEFTSFEIDKNHNIKVKTENVNGDIGINEVKNYEITEEGKIVEVK